MQHSHLLEAAQAIAKSHPSDDARYFAIEVIQALKPLSERAADYRKSNSVPDTGYILVFEHEIYGWKKELTHPEREQPGVIAIDPKNRRWVATGGDSYNGAKSWTPLF